ncbi:hypothetical protein [Antrihabitans cavernicola]|uniref:Uncharacterized protein n=1 Tax=Antrihabitans cavernicola TaxID=2495913 RepID=A0A5A7SAM3_9NOCA|nr:hypothetical protein [Spelaeibacter cavernicola]KAA0021261.1 hypothetical protein FOY51_20420 [Spelaeibacter cavernicola]
MAGKKIDRVRAQSALETVRENPVIAAVALAPAVVIFALVWWLAGPVWAILLLILAGAGVVFGGKFLK